MNHDVKSQGFVVSYMEHIKQTLKKKQITKTRFESTVSYLDGLFVLPAKYQAWLLPKVGLCNIKNLNYAQRLNTMFSVSDIDSVNLEIMILLEAVLMVHNALYPVVQYDEKWSFFNRHCLNTSLHSVSQGTRAPSALDYEVKMMTLLDKVVEYECAVALGTQKRGSRNVKEAFDLLVELCIMNRVATLSYSHKSRCERLELDGVSLLSQDRGIVVYSTLKKFLDYEDISEVVVVDSILTNFIMHCTTDSSKSGNSNDGVSMNMRQDTVKKLRLNIPDYFTDTVLKHYMQYANN